MSAAWRAIGAIVILSLVSFGAAACSGGGGGGGNNNNGNGDNNNGNGNPSATPDPNMTPEPTAGIDCVDQDQDGFSVGADCTGVLDCDDNDRDRHPELDERCDGKDNDCDDTVDEDVLTPDCALTRGVCAGSRQSCTGGGFQECGGTASYGDSFEENETTCDGADNDCDGMTDEGCPCDAGSTQVCGTSEGACEDGIQSCVAGEWGPCEGEVSASDEVCDNLDNDCDGSTDEEIEPVACALQNGVCAGSTRGCAGGSFPTECGQAEYGADWVGDEGAANCDGKDNDCDGEVDEGCSCTDGDTQPCGSDVGLCQRGVQTCENGAFGECRDAVDAAPEACNGEDDDCDGEPDEAIEDIPGCTLQRGVCAGSQKPCGGAAGFLDCDQAIYAAHDANYLVEESGEGDDCDGIDNDCDGQVDEGCDCANGDTQVCGINQGECTQGTQTCEAGRWGPCSGQGPVDERCDGADNDCDGATDEDLTHPQCALQRGVCAGTVQRCDSQAGDFASCGDADYGPFFQQNETICDRRDNDCDGEVDEGCTCVDNTEQDCGSSVGECRPGSQLCVRGDWGRCEGSVDPVDEVCDGLDNNCDGETDENLTAPDCALTRGVCAGSRQTCGGESGWQSCGDADYGPSYRSNESTPGDCDGVDNDCDGETDEGCDCVGGDTRSCGSSIGECRLGTQTCTGGAWGSCDGEITAVDEVCDDLDNDCDGATDDIEPTLCPLQEGICAGSVQRCGGLLGLLDCTFEDYDPVFYLDVEDGVACDGIDNDCDGDIDEGCPAPFVLINELYYDGPGADTGRLEFIELWGDSGAALSGISLEAVNGANGDVYWSLDLTGQFIGSNGYFVIVEEGDGGVTDGATGFLRDIANMTADGVNLQNGPDNLRLVHRDFGQLDALGYGDFEADDFFFGHGFPALDVSGDSLTRDEMHSDSLLNNIDFRPASTTPMRFPTPGGVHIPQVAARLSWTNPVRTDLDLHLLTPGSGFRGDGDCSYAPSDVELGVPNDTFDDCNLLNDSSFGDEPETVRITAPWNGEYVLNIHWFSAAINPASAPASVEVQVEIFIDGLPEQTLETIMFPTSDIHWNVGTFVVDEGEVIWVATDTTGANPPDAPPAVDPPAGFTPQPDHVELQFSIDDSVNRSFGPGDLAWKGSFVVDNEQRRTVAFDPGWGGGTGPYPLLWDDGAWDTGGGHEPPGSVAGDGVWGVSVWVPVDANERVFEYGAEIAPTATWIWEGPNGTFTVPGGSTQTVMADGLVIPAWGDRDIFLTLDTNNLAEGWAFDPVNSIVSVRGPFVAWFEIFLNDDGQFEDEVAGDGIYTFQLSPTVGPGTSFPHLGLLHSGTEVPFLWGIDGVDYIGDDPCCGGVSVGLTDGVSYEVDDGLGNFTPGNFGREADGDQNPTMIVP